MMVWSPETRDPNGSHGLPPVTVTVPSRKNLLQDLRRRLDQGRGFSIATLNLDHVVKLRRDPAFRQAYSDHSHITADGRPVVWLSCLSGSNLALITGSDLVDPLSALCAEIGAPVALMGTTAEVLERAAESLKAKYPGLTVVAQIAPPMGFDPKGPAAETVMTKIAESGARVCFLALGAPKQEIFAARAAKAHPCIGFVSVGAGLDFIAGTQRRAPRIVRALAAEWLWRLAINPWRLAGRYAACIAVLPRLLFQALAARRAGRDVA